jgi:hypothetical protein
VGLVMVWDGKPCKRQRDGAESKAHTWSTLLNHLQAPASPTLLRSFPKKRPLFPPIFLVSLLVEERAGGGGGRRGGGGSCGKTHVANVGMALSGAGHAFA